MYQQTQDAKFSVGLFVGFHLLKIPAEGSKTHFIASLMSNLQQ